MPDFRLDKWFLDLVTESGSAAIIYCAELSWGIVHIRWTSVLEAAPGQQPHSRFSLTGYSGPAVNAASLSWEHGPLAVKARYQFQQIASPITLFDSPEATVHWHCLSPLAEATVQLGDRQLAGQGYAERLQMTLPPWKLPIDTLRWGHFAGPSQSLVWIRWEGAHPLKVALLNGRPVDAAEIADDRISVEAASLDLDRGTTLRDGPISGTVLHSIPGLTSLLPASIAGVTESKWLSRGHLCGRPGQAIHEKVQFGRTAHD